MAGHSKWAQIKRKKAVTDARRGKLWTKLLKEITVAARLGGADPAGDPRLRTAIQEAKANNVPNANIERAIKKGTGELGGSDFEEITYEGYGPGGVAVLVEAMTDNRNRTVSDVRHLFTKHGGNLGENGCVGWLFAKRGLISIDRSTIAEDDLMEIVVELGADDLSADDEVYEVLTAPDAYHAVLGGLRDRGVEIASHSLAMLPSTTVEIDEESAPQVLKLMEMLEDHDDVQNVWANFDIDAELLAGVG
jgi:YebC/PmpR family DNA-binding regulatory protein